MVLGHRHLGRYNDLWISTQGRGCVIEVRLANTISHPLMGYRTYDRKAPSNRPCQDTRHGFDGQFPFLGRDQRPERPRRAPCRVHVKTSLSKCTMQNYDGNQFPSGGSLEDDDHSVLGRPFGPSTSREGLYRLLPSATPTLLYKGIYWSPNRAKHRGTPSCNRLSLTTASRKPGVRASQLVLR